MIPKKLQIEGIRFVLVERAGKKPFQLGWQDKRIGFNDPELIRHIESGGNYGVIGGGSKNLLIVDFDNAKVQDDLLLKLPETLTIKTGSGMMHKYFFSNGSQSFKIFDEDMNTLVDVQGEGKQAICVGSVHPNGNKYELIEDKDIAFIDYAELKALIMPYDRKPKKECPVVVERPVEYSNDSFIDLVKSRVRVEDVLSKFGVNTSRNPSNCPFHNSKGGKCLGWKDEVAHCFHCEGKWNVFSLVKDFKKYDFKQALLWLTEEFGLQKEQEESRKKYLDSLNSATNAEFSKAIKFFTDKKHLANQFLSIQPIYYDKSKLWWIWNAKAKCWSICDEVDIMNEIARYSEANTIGTKERTEIIEALKQESRKNKPLDIESNWIQFKDKIIDINTNMIIESSPKYFTTNPIPWELGTSDETPTMDRIFKEWVGEKYVKTLYEILAYSLLSDYPIHRIFCFIGSGMNGKSKYLDLLRNFVGKDNCCSTELDNLINSRFEVARLHRKLVCQMGETNFGELSKTSMLKKLSGGDLIGFEYKSKNPFEDKNYAKIIISTNNLPATTDKTIGFYRRWMIIDFPNRFNEKKDILADIPLVEYNNLALKCCRILTELLAKREFHEEGSIEERMERYESKSNFIDMFIKTYTQESYTGYITKSDFYKRFVAWSKENRHRELSDQSVSVFMKKMGIIEERKYFDWLYDGKGGQARVWSGIEWK
jgi:P4 family phage/plasmid primase-like protien